MFKLALLLALASAAAAKQCRSLTIPVSLTARNGIFNIEPPKTELEVTKLMLALSQQNGNYTDTITQGFNTVKGDYKLAATYCEPDRGPGDTLQILTHGVGFDSSYWDFPFDNVKYSYVNRAIDMGYSTLSWDRLGIGHSSHGDPISEIQIFLEIAALKELTKHAKTGRCGSKFKKIVHVGHSFGSLMTFALTNMYPTISDAIILTGFSQVPTFLGLFLLGGNFAPVKEISTLKDQYAEGYVAPKTRIGVQTNFFATGDFDPRVLDIATKTGQPAAVGELLTLGSVGSTSRFGGPVLVITGEKDVPFCGGDCRNAAVLQNSAPNLIEESKTSFTQASAFNATIVPGAGHGLNLQHSSKTTYKTMLDFLESHL